jgi:hypothetical protein
MTLKTGMKELAALFPPFRRLLAERDDLRRKNDGLEQELATAARELKTARAKFLAAWQQREKFWMPPGHFYSPIPSIPDVKLNEHEIFECPPAIRGVDLNETGQLELLRQLAVFYPDQPFAPEAIPGRRYLFENPNYSYNDAIVLYCMMRHARPRRIIEIGSGYSSCAMMDVNELFLGDSIDFTFIDPYPQLLRDIIKESDRDRVCILGQRAQDVDPDLYRKLAASDILFVDSSHIAKTGSDVNYIIFKILPLLEEGVFIHFHDVFYPFEYPLEWVYEGRGWNEAYVLRAFLQYNRAFEIQFFNSFLVEKHRTLFESLMPLCFKRTGANLWLQKKRCDPELERLHDRKERRPRPVPRELDPTSPEDAWCLKQGWYEPEPDHCWMTQSATFQVAGPVSAEQRLVINAVSPVDGSQLTATADGIPLGSCRLEHAGSVSAGFALPDSLTGRECVTVELTIDRVHVTPDDPRKLGLAVSRIQVR